MSRAFQVKRPPMANSIRTLSVAFPKPTQTSNSILQSLARRSSSSLEAAAAVLEAESAEAVDSKKKKPYWLVIVESPSKCQTISDLLQSNSQLPTDDVRVVSCLGHVRNLPRSNPKNTEVVSKAEDSKTSNFPYSIVGIDLERGEYEPQYVLLPGKESLVADLKKQAKEAEHVLLATDPDREGEAIAWHLQQVLELTEDEPGSSAAAAAGNKKQKTTCQRISFAEITPTAVGRAVDALTAASADDNTDIGRLQRPLVEAQETRRVLDRLAGYTVSPLLWKLISPGLSAGRVQSVGLQLVVQRERERLRFESTEYWDLRAQGVVAVTEEDDDGGAPRGFPCHLVAIQDQPLAAAGSDFAPQGRQLQESSAHKRHLRNEEEAQAVCDALIPDSAVVTKVTHTSRSKNPPAPYRTSTLQQDAHGRLGWSVQHTMRVAQELYEGGYISYMRTDSTSLSPEATTATQNAIQGVYGRDQVGDAKTVAKPKKKAVAAQEAHEAIRPALQSSGAFCEPKLVQASQAGQQLYKFIYQRTLASHMKPQKLNQTQVELEANGEDDLTATFRASGRIVLDPGFRLAYGDSDEDGDDNNKLLPPLYEGQSLRLDSLETVPHQTLPPPRFTEASLVKQLEALGVGRPSTYAGTIQILRDRAYVGSPKSGGRASKRNTPSGPAISAQRAAGAAEFGGKQSGGPLAPSLSAMVVCSLLERHCPSYVDPSFTAEMEERLDAIARGDGTAHRVEYLNDFYAGDNGLAAQVQRMENDADKVLARRVILPALEDSDESLGLFIGPWGPYIQELNEPVAEGSKPLSVALPQGLAADIAAITPQILKALLTTKEQGGLILGQHPEDGRNIYLKSGRYGPYLTWGDDGESDTTNHSIPPEKASYRLPEEDDEGSYDGDDLQLLRNLVNITLDEAVGFTGLPRSVGTLDDMPITASIGPYGPYLKYNGKFTNLKDHDILTVDEETAKQIVTDEIINGKSKGAKNVVAELGEKDGSAVTVKDGRFGMYVNWKKVNANLPMEYTENPSELPLEKAWEMIQAKADAAAAKAGKSKGRKASPSVVLPPAPKRPLSGYLHFCAEHRPEVAETVKKLGDISKRLSELWADTSDDDRKKYEALAQEGKEKYSVAKSEWQAECAKLQGGKSKKSQSAKAWSPKRPKSAYLFFCAAKRPEVAEKVSTLGEISKELARIWAETTDRSEYETLAAADKERYEQEKKEGEPGTPDDAPLENGATAQKTKKLKVVTTSPTSSAKATKKKTKTKRSPSAYMLFCKEYRPTIVDADGKKLPLGETTQKLASLWRDCDAETKEKFQDLAAKEKEAMSVA